MFQFLQFPGYVVGYGTFDWYSSVFVAIADWIYYFWVQDTLGDIVQLYKRGMVFIFQVAASRVKARQASAGLAGLQGASRNGMLTSL